MAMAAAKLIAGEQIFKNLPAFAVRLGRGLYLTSAGILTLAVYQGVKNQSEDGFLVALRDGALKPEDADNPVALGLSAAGQAVQGATDQVAAGVNGTSKPEKFNERNYNKRAQAFARIGQHFGLTVTSLGRTDAENARVNGSETSLHLFSRGALAGDLGGPIENERRCYEWAKARTDLFQEVLYHNAGSGLHVHIAFKPGVFSVDTFGR